jgi:hypothetical protein
MYTYVYICIYIWGFWQSERDERIIWRTFRYGHIRIYTYICIYKSEIFINTNMCMYSCTCVYVYIYIYILICVFDRVRDERTVWRTFRYVYIRIYIYMYIYIYVYMYIYMIFDRVREMSILLEGPLDMGIIYFSDWFHFVLMPFWLVRISMEIDFITHCHVVIYIK